ncbi:MAG: hypothetical protein A3D94_16400 [Alphaproteobacteria bacterium RIFCSPHIGHO2_12_FULL_66_14]|nr:MAG: hypothetical protein A3D94_16400 [Alphaproteobacteria bacterium RIFCSPHIGHO2_12_FULL_66_14]
MRKIGDASFFRIVDRLLASGTGRTPVIRWSIDGVHWQRERHSYAGVGHGFTIEVTRGTRAAKPGWTLVVVKEYWRAAGGESMKSLQWAHIEAGSRAEVVAWLERQERKLESE